MATVIKTSMLTYGVPLHCRDCSKGFVSQHTMHDVHCDVDALQMLIVRHFQHCIPNIPVGWSMNGRNDIRCGECS